MLPRRGQNKLAQGNALGTVGNKTDVAVTCEKPDSSRVQHQVRRPWIAKNYRNALFAYQAGIFREWDSPAITIGGVEDHVHALVDLSKNHPLKKIVEEVKKGSSKWTKTDGPRNLEFHWQAGYAAFSVSQSNLDEVKRYIENQEEHHRKLTFQEELRAFYRRQEIEFDERYVWD